MTGKLLGILLMALAAILAWKWLRGAGTTRPPAPRRQAGEGRRGEQRRSEQRREKVIELRQDADGVYRPRNDQEHGTKP